MSRKSKINRTHSEMIPDAFVACQMGDLKALQAMLHNGVSVDLNNGMDSLISESVSSGQHAVVDLLIGGGANVNFVDGLFETPLMVAVKNQDSCMVNKLIAAGADVNAVQPNNDFSVLLSAALMGGVKICVDLIKSGAKWWVSTGLEHLLLHRLLEIDDGTIFAEISSQKEWSRKKSKHGCTFAHVASFLGKTELLQLAIKAGAFINAIDRTEVPTLLHKAFMANSPACVAYLLEAGASVHVTNAEGMTPVHLGIVFKKGDAVVTYMKHLGASPLGKISQSVCKKYKGQDLETLFAGSLEALQALAEWRQAHQSLTAEKALEAVFLGNLAHLDNAQEQSPRKRPMSMQL